MKLRITIENKTYEVDVEAVEPDSRPAAPRGYAVEPASVRVPAGLAVHPPAQPQAAAPVNEEKVCRSPVAGVVVRVVVQPGQELQAGDVLLVLEAMKMETNITAPSAGKVAAIGVRAGDAVQMGQVVVELE